MRTSRISIAALALAAASGALLWSGAGSGQTAYPYRYGISNLGETCGGGCSSGYICCAIVVPK